MGLFTQIYETMLGLLEPEAALDWVDSAFGEGAHCTREYAQMREAYERICERLGVENEDEDLEIIVNSLESIQRELCERMFSAGSKYESERLYMPRQKP